MSEVARTATIAIHHEFGELNNPNFNPVEFDRIKKQAGLNSFTLTPNQWINQTESKGLISSTGRYGRRIGRLSPGVGL